MEVLRNLNDWKINEYEVLLSTLMLISLNKDYDQSLWTLNAIEKLTFGPYIDICLKMNPLRTIFHSNKKEDHFLTIDTEKTRGKIILN